MTSPNKNNEISNNEVTALLMLSVFVVSCNVITIPYLTVAGVEEEGAQVSEGMSGVLMAASK